MLANKRASMSCHLCIQILAKIVMKIMSICFLNTTFNLSIFFLSFLSGDFIVDDKYFGVKIFGTRTLWI